MITSYSDNLVFDQNGTYSRTCSKERDNLENALKSLYGSQWCEITSSGLNAVHLAVSTVLANKMGEYVLIANEIFSFSKPVIGSICQTYSKKIIEFDQTNSDQIINLLAKYNKNIALIFFESCSNPSSRTTDLSLVKNMHDSGAIVIVDNTWLSPIKCNPFHYDVDIVIDSCTKYVSGGMCIAGCINFKEYNEITKKCARQLCLTGIHVPETLCKLIYNQLSTLEHRVIVATERTKQIVNFLRNNNNVKIVCYNDKYSPCVVLFCLDTKNGSIIECERILEQLAAMHLINYSTSFGKPIDSVDNYPTLTEQGLWLRLAVGYEDDATFIDRLGLFIINLYDLLQQ